MKLKSALSSSALSGKATVNGGDRSVHSCRPENPQTQHGKASLGKVTDRKQYRKLLLIDPLVAFAGVSVRTPQLFILPMLVVSNVDTEA